MTKRYLGDGVYVDWDGHHLVLTAENGIAATNTIFLELPVWRALEEYFEDLETELTAAARESR